MDRFLAQHAEIVRLEIGEQEQRQSRMLESQEAIMNKLKEKDEEIQRMGKLNWVLEERVKSLCIEQEQRQSRMLESQEVIMNRFKGKDEEIQLGVKLRSAIIEALQEEVRSLRIENQIWRDSAQTNEATVNALRSNLEQVLAHNAEDRHVAAMADDAELCCGSNNFGRCTPPPLDDGGNEAVGGGGGGNRMCKNCGSNYFGQCTPPPLDDGGNEAVGGGGGNRMCKNCGVGESRVLLLPCRHLCLCTNCGSTLRTCPVCHSVMTASVNV